LGRLDTDTSRRCERSFPEPGSLRHNAPPEPSRNQAEGTSSFSINLTTRFDELLRLFLHTDIEGFCGFDLFLSRVVADFLGDLHRAEVRPAHRTEVRQLRTLLRQRFVVILTRHFRIEREIELVLPAKLEPRF